MDTIGAHPFPQALAPSRLVSADPNTEARMGEDDLTATPALWHALWFQRRIQVRSNHPIPPDSPTFYYEMTIIETGPLGYVRIVAI
jgi:hypothetical protein